MTFTESNTVEQMILNAVTKLGGKQTSMVRKDALPYRGEMLGDELRQAHWIYAFYDQVPRQLTCPRFVYARCSTRDRK